MELFPRNQIAGIFRGFTEGGLEFHADLLLPYRSELQRLPIHGQFVLVQLETADEAVLGRIISVSSEGKLASSAGEDYGIRAMSEDRAIPEDLREQYLKYRVGIRVLGVVRTTPERVVFVPSHRRLPHVGSPVAFLSPEVIRAIIGHDGPGAELGFLSLGEFVYAEDDFRLKPPPWMRVQGPKLIVRFDADSLVSRRTFVFARAGFGKSNLLKLLLSGLYQATPTVRKRGGRQVPVGTVVFDPDGEYFWPDDKDRPGLCDVAGLEDQLVVFTSKTPPSPYYGSYCAGGIKLDIRRLRPSDVISIALSPERQEQQNVRRLKALSDQAWSELVDDVYYNGNSARDDLFRKHLNLQPSQEPELLAARANLTAVVRMLHDPSSQLVDLLLAALRDGKLCVVDVSQLRGTPAFVLAGLILRRIFDHNQLEFTSATPATIPTIAVIEEAQTVLGGGSTLDNGPYVEWVKEGRKYDLGAVLVTQQPGSIANEILSQGDNWFVFHLLSAEDLQRVKRANAHYSDDLLSALLNEPIPGHGVVWSSAGERPFPLSVRVLSFEDLCPLQDPTYCREAIPTYASGLKHRFESMLRATADRVSENGAVGSEEVRAPLPEEAVDALETYRRFAIAEFGKSDEAQQLKSRGIPYGVVVGALEKLLPKELDRRGAEAYNLVPRAVNELLGGPQEEAWHSEARTVKSRATPMNFIVPGPAKQ